MESVTSLLMITIAPLIFSLVVIIICFGRGSSIFEKIVSSLSLNPNNGLMKQGVLWLSILTPFIYFIVLGACAWTDYTIDISSKGFSEFLKVSTLPIAILSLSIPLSILIARLHATEQTAKQIELVSHKNNLDSFYSHRKELFTYFDQIEPVNFLSCFEAKFNIHPRVHKCFFTGSPSNGIPEINKKAFEKVECELRAIRRLIDLVIRDVHSDMTFNFYISVCSSIYMLSEKLGLPEIYVNISDKSVFVPAESTISAVTVGTTTDELIASYRYARAFFLNMCDFAAYIPELESSEDELYIDNGGQYKTIREPLVIEYLHETIIRPPINEGYSMA